MLVPIVCEVFRFFEVDAPASQRKATLQCDFATVSLLDKLVENGFDTKNRQPVFICEGVSMYFEPSEVEAMMKQVSTRSAFGTRFAVQVSRTDGTPPSKENQRLG